MCVCVCVCIHEVPADGQGGSAGCTGWFVFAGLTGGQAAVQHLRHLLPPQPKVRMRAAYMGRPGLGEAEHFDPHPSSPLGTPPTLAHPPALTPVHCTLYSLAREPSPPRPRPCALYRAGEHGASVLQCLEEQDRKCRMFLMVEERSPRVSPGGEGRDNIRKMAKKVVQVFTTIKVCVYLHVHVCSCLLALARHNPGALQAGVCLSARLVCLPLTTCPALPCLALSLVAGECGGRR